MLPCPQHQAQWRQRSRLAIRSCPPLGLSTLIQAIQVRLRERDKTNKNVQKSRNDSLFQMFLPFHSFIQFPFSENTTQTASSQTSIILHKSNKTLSHFSGTQHPGPKLARFRGIPIKHQGRGFMGLLTSFLCVHFFKCWAKAAAPSMRYCSGLFPSSAEAVDKGVTPVTKPMPAVQQGAK